MINDGAFLCEHGKWARSCGACILAEIQGAPCVPLRTIGPQTAPTAEDRLAYVGPRARRGKGFARWGPQGISSPDMARPPSPDSPAALLAATIASLTSKSTSIELPRRDVGWERRETPSDTALAELRRVIAFLAVKGPVAGVYVAVEGVCRVMLGGTSGLRGSGERFTAIVAHVTADGEPVRTVILPVE